MLLRASKMLFVVLSFTLLSAENAFSACGKFVVAKGVVQVEVLKTKLVERAKINTEICAGDTVSAGADSRAKIVMVDGNELNISPDSKMTIEGYEYQPDQGQKKVLLNVLFGKVRANVKQKYDDQPKDSTSNSFQVKTKSAVAGVRGTDFLTSFDNTSGKSEVVTFSGKVDVGQPGPNGQIANAVSVGAGQKTSAAPNQPPSTPTAVPPGELKQLNNSTNASTAQSGNAGGSSSNATGGKNSQASNSSSSSSSSANSSSSSSSGSSGSSASSSSSSTSSSSTAASTGAPAPDRAPATDNSAPAPAAPAPSAAAPAPPAGASATVSMNSMTPTTALDGGGGVAPSSAPPPPPTVALPPVPILPPVAAPFQPPPCAFCNAAVQAGGPANLNIAITTHK